MNFSTPLPATCLGQIVSDVLDEVDNEVSPKQIVRWVNLELGSLSAKREWNFFFKYGTAVTLGIMDSTTFESIMVLPRHMKKIFRIYVDQTKFEQGTNYEVVWDGKNNIWNAIFKNYGNSTVTNMYLDYYMEPRCLSKDDDETEVPSCFANVITLAVLRRAKIKLMDTDEAIMHDRQYKEELTSMIDDDAREHDLPSTLQPSRHQTPDEYSQYLHGQLYGENGLNGMGVALTHRYR